jgi:glutamate dehydrogenase (NAD(P)+)
MAWIYDTYAMMHGGANNRPVVTGKPINLGGSLGRREATGRGVLISTKTYLENAGLPGLDGVSGARVAIQGFGNVGAVAADLFALEGATIVALSDSRGGIYDPEGIDVKKAVLYKQETGKLQGFDATQPISNEELLTCNCDILIPAALENAITEENVGGIKARLIVEAANGPISFEADETLMKNGVAVVPDILANAGGVIVSFFEWVQNLHSEEWSEEDVNHRLEEKLSPAVVAVMAKARELRTISEEAGDEPLLHSTHLRTAAYVVSLERLVNATLQRGIWP